MSTRYTATKIFRFPDKLASLDRAAGRIAAPLHVRLKPTNVCNHHCRYCAYRVKTLQLGRDMSPGDSIPKDKITEIIGDFAAMGVRAVTFSGGGEPLCYQHMAHALRLLADTDIRFATLTNGGRLGGEAAEILAARATWVRVSIDGWDGPSYAAYRGVPADAFAGVLRNLAAFRALGGACALGAVIIVDAHNHDRLHGLIRLLGEAGVQSVKVSPCIVSNDAAENNAYHEPYLGRVGDQVARAQADFGRSMDIYNGYHLQLRSFAKPYSWCPHLQITPVVGADLNVYTCQDKAYNLEEGLVCSIADRPFRDAWMDGKDKFYRLDPSKLCRHHCVGHGQNLLIHEYLDADPDHLVFA